MTAFRDPRSPKSFLGFCLGCSSNCIIIRHLCVCPRAKMLQERAYHLISSLRRGLAVTGEAFVVVKDAEREVVQKLDTKLRQAISSTGLVTFCRIILTQSDICRAVKESLRNYPLRTGELSTTQPVRQGGSLSKADSSVPKDVENQRSDVEEAKTN